MVIELILLSVAMATINSAPYSCPEAKDIVDKCIQQGYQMKRLRYCVKHDVGSNSKEDLKPCNKAEKVLYTNCGYRQCSDDNRIDDVESSSPNTDMAVATDNDACTQIGAAALERGGSAVDAAISALICLGAVQPQSSGIGGGGFMVIHTDSEDRVVNFRETAPQAATQDMYVEDPTLSFYGGLACGVPGEVAGYWKAHKHFGKLNWVDLWKPAIKLLQRPIPVTSRMEYSISRAKSKIFKDKNLRRIFFNNQEDEESYKKEGETFQNPKLGKTYKKIADLGPNGFYRGQIARNIVKALSARGGIMTRADLKHYKALLQDPLKLSYRNNTVLTVPPPASGHVITLVLQLLDRLDIRQGDAIAWGNIIEAIRFGYALRGQTGDKDYSEKTRSILELVQNGTWAEQIFRKHLNKRGRFRGPYDQADKYIALSESLYENRPDHGTTHVSVIGPDGSAVSVTSTVNTGFGCKVMTDHGVILNNQMDDFSTPGTVNYFGYPAAPENFIVPGKRPMSSTSALVMIDHDNQARFVSGASGGSRIITSTLQSLINVLDFRYTLKRSVRARRIHDQLTDMTQYESGFAEDLVSELSSAGYNMVEVTSPVGLGAVASVSRVMGLEAEGDPRKSGTGQVIPLQEQ